MRVLLVKTVQANEKLICRTGGQGSQEKASRSAVNKYG